MGLPQADFVLSGRVGGTTEPWRTVATLHGTQELLLTNSVLARASSAVVQLGRISGFVDFKLMRLMPLQIEDASSKTVECEVTII